jgi:hypothetical protein
MHQLWSKNVVCVMLSKRYVGFRKLGTGTHSVILWRGNIKGTNTQCPSLNFGDNTRIFMQVKPAG